MAHNAFHNVARVSKLFQPKSIPLQKSTQKSSIASKSYRHMLRYGIIRPVNPGMYALLPLGVRVIEKLTAIIDSEMSKIGAQKLLLPALTETSLWKKSKRLEDNKSELFMTRDRHSKEYLLSPTHEEAICELLSTVKNISQKMLPLYLYQISMKWRNEMKPRLGFLRSKEFIMKDLYTFDLDMDGANKTYELLLETYDNIFKKIGIEYVRAIGDTGSIGGELSHEYHYLSEIGEDQVLVCNSCSYNINRTIFSESQCPHCKGDLSQHTASEVAHAFLLNTKYSTPFEVSTARENVCQPLVMGCFGIGISRIFAVLSEVLSTEDELRWPRHLAPYTVCVIPPKEGSKEDVAAPYVDGILETLNQLNIDTILDDRTSLTIGNRIIYAKTTGFPYLVIVGKSATQPAPLIEIYDTNSDKQLEVPLEGVHHYFSELKINN